MAQNLAQETIWFDKHRADDAERNFYESKGSPSCAKTAQTATSSIADEIARVRQHIKHSLQSAEHVVSTHSTAGCLDVRVSQLEKENKDMKNVVQDLRSALSKMEARVAALEISKAGVNGLAASPVKKQAPQPPVKSSNKDDDDDDVDLFGSDDEDDAEGEALKAKRAQEYAAKKSKKPAVIAKSSIVMDIKPWDDETDMGAMEKQVRGISMDGLKWGASKLVPLAYGIKKLQIVLVVEDDKVSIDLLQEKIEEFEDLVQSVDIAAFNKL